MTTPIPSFFNPQTVGSIWRVPYQQRADDAIAYRKQHNISPATDDNTRVCLLAIDVQNTFCVPDFELFVGGRSGTGAVEDTQRLCEFIYQNIETITEIIPTMDTHSSAQIFHPSFWVDEAGKHPAPMTMISYEDVKEKKWRVNPLVAQSLLEQGLIEQGLAEQGLAEQGLADQKSIGPNQTATADGVQEIQAFANHYAKQLSDRGKYPLTIWPYHSMLGGIGHALVPAFEEACFFHNMVRSRPTRFEAKGDNPLTENYSVLSPEVLTNESGQAIAQKNNRLIQYLLTFDAIIIAGQAKSHCVAWTVSDLLSEIQSVDPEMAKKVYLLEDCTSPVVVPDVIDFTDEANRIYDDFEKSGMHRVLAVDRVNNWPAFSMIEK